MRNMNLDRGWIFSEGSSTGQDSIGRKKQERIVNLPHDYMIENEVDREAPAGPAMGYYNAGIANYTKKIEIPKTWEGEIILLKFDGVMMNATVQVNGCFAALQHYGYVPFTVDITPYVYFGEENRIVITTNPGLQPGSRWYTGAGIFRSVQLVHKPEVSIPEDGIYGYTERIEYNEEGGAEVAFLQTEIQVANCTGLNRIAEVCVFLTDAETGQIVVSRKQRIQINPNACETAYIPVTVEKPALWEAECPNLYLLHARVTTIGTFGAHFTEAARRTTDASAVLFGIRTITTDSRYGLRINGKVVKLKGGCIHHDNGVLGAVSYYDSEVRRIRKLKEIGFNAIRTAHNPPSTALMEACDRLGMYVFSEAFDAWGMMKQPGDYSMYFASDWEKDLSAFIRRDRNHPSVILWSTGNEIPEHGGLNNGYTLATGLVRAIRSLDDSRPISNGICSYWTGLDDRESALQVAAYERITKDQSVMQQNFSFDAVENAWEEKSEAFVNGLDVVGYNYLEDKYRKDHELYPERVILGSENYPKEIGKRWPMVEKTPYVIGDFTWTAWDYIGEAGIGKSIMAEPEDPILMKGPYELMSHTSEFPWRTANDADVDINGCILPQGYYRSIVWGSDSTYLFSYSPEDYGKVEMTSMWGFTRASRTWNWQGYEGRRVRLVVFSRAFEVELFLNGVSLGRKRQEEAPATDGLPLSFVFDAIYSPGEVVAVGYTAGREMSRDTLRTAGIPCEIKIEPDKRRIKADGHSLAYIELSVVDKLGNTVPDVDTELSVSVEGAGHLLGAGSANPITTDNYSTGRFHTYRGRALVVVRSGYEAGDVIIRVSSEEYGSQLIHLDAVHIEASLQGRM